MSRYSVIIKEEATAATSNGAQVYAELVEVFKLSPC